jgi:hypothetical protein
MSETVLHLPYGGTSGWSGSQTSLERAVSEDNNGITQSRQFIAQRFLRDCGYSGATWKELGAQYNWHHGQATAVLSVLHKEGVIRRLSSERRGRSSVYVLPEYVGNREFASHGSKTKRDESFWRNTLADEMLLRVPEQQNGFLPNAMPIADVIALIEAVRNG